MVHLLLGEVLTLEEGIDVGGTAVVGVGVGTLHLLERSTWFFEMYLFRSVLGLKVDFSRNCPLFRGSPKLSRINRFTYLGPKSNQIAQKCCEADLRSRFKASGHALGRSAWFFENYLGRLVLGLKIDCSECD